MSGGGEQSGLSSQPGIQVAVSARAVPFLPEGMVPQLFPPALGGFYWHRALSEGSAGGRQRLLGAGFPALVSRREIPTFLFFF